jgi:hypothetical protein
MMSNKNPDRGRGLVDHLTGIAKVLPLQPTVFGRGRSGTVSVVPTAWGRRGKRLGCDRDRALGVGEQERRDIPAVYGRAQRKIA